MGGPPSSRARVLTGANPLTFLHHQRGLSEAHTLLFAERERALSLQAQVDSLSAGREDDARRMQDLIAASQPVMQEVTYARRSAPEMVSLNPRYRGVANTAEGEAAKGAKGAASKAAAHSSASLTGPGVIGPVGEGERVLRTVYLPTERGDTLQLKVDSLTRQLAETKALMEERVEALLEDREIRERDTDAAAAMYAERIKELLNKEKELKTALMKATDDMLRQRADSHSKQERAAERCAALEETAHALSAEAFRAAAERDVAAALLPDGAAGVFADLRDEIAAKSSTLAARAALLRRRDNATHDAKLAAEERREAARAVAASRRHAIEAAARAAATRRSGDRLDAARAEVLARAAEFKARAVASAEDAKVGLREEAVRGAGSAHVSAAARAADAAGALARDKEARAAQARAAAAGSAEEVRRIEEDLAEAERLASLDAAEAQAAVAELERKVADLRAAQARGASAASRIGGLDRQLAAVRQTAATSGASAAAARAAAVERQLRDARATVAAGQRAAALQPAVEEELRAARDEAARVAGDEGQRALKAARARAASLQAALAQARLAAEAASHVAIATGSEAAEARAAASRAASARDSIADTVAGQVFAAQQRAAAVDARCAEECQRIDEAAAAEVAALEEGAAGAEQALLAKELGARAEELALADAELEAALTAIDTELEAAVAAVDAGAGISVDGKKSCAESMVELNSRLAAAQMNIDGAAKRARAELNAKLTAQMNAYKLQIAKSEAHAVGLENALAAVRQQYEVRVADLEEALKKLRAAHAKLQRRRAHDVEGWGADISAMRKKVSATERRLHQLRLCHRLDDDEKLDALLESLAARAPSPERERAPLRPTSAGSNPRKAARKPKAKATAKAISTAPQVAKAMAELLDIKEALSSMSDRVHSAASQ